MYDRSFQIKEEERLLLPVDNVTAEEQRQGTQYSSPDISYDRANQERLLVPFFVQVSSKRDALEEKSTGARNDYLLSLAAANAHQNRYFVIDLQSTMQVNVWYYSIIKRKNIKAAINCTEHKFWMIR